MTNWRVREFRYEERVLRINGETVYRSVAAEGFYASDLLEDIDLDMCYLSMGEPSIPRQNRNSLKFYKISDKCRPSLQGYQSCIIIASYGDKHPDGVKVVPKKKATAFLPGVREDVEKFQSLVAKDKLKELAFSLADYPAIQKSKWHYLEYIKRLMKSCSNDGG